MAESNNKIVKGKMLENFLYGDNYLKPEETQALYVDFTSRHKGLKPKTEEFKEAIMQDGRRGTEGYCRNGEKWAQKRRKRTSGLCYVRDSEQCSPYR